MGEKLVGEGTECEFWGGTKGSELRPGVRMSRCMASRMNALQPLIGSGV
jgi:hypothetical protein